jgi:hypothetical protein
LVGGAGTKAKGIEDGHFNSGTDSVNTAVTIKKEKKGIVEHQKKLSGSNFSIRSVDNEIENRGGQHLAVLGI